VIHGSPTGLFIRPASAADVPAMMKLERQSPAAAHWTRQRYRDIFLTGPDQPRAGRFAWVVEKRRAEAEQAPTEPSEQIVGFLVAHQIHPEWELENIMVAPSAQRRGVGTSLMGEFIARARAEGGTNIFLEVRESNQNARALYRKLGFYEAGLRFDYYSSPRENAVIYRLELPYTSPEMRGFS
jgi:ribosomal-protein-alanine N-acetyltransferase